ncbi:MAG TPA: AIM24 family protein [Nannocystaceae bacterium]|nr:AIM24 family protein [Nannocystaceae bacterium]
MSDAELTGLTEFAFNRLLRPQEGGASLSCGASGHLMIAVRGEVAACLEGAVTLSESLQIRRLSPRSRGVRIDGGLAHLVGVSGEGHVVIAPQGQVFHVVRLRRDTCYLRESVVWALEGEVGVDVGLLPGSRRDGSEGVSMLRLHGDGTVALRVPGEVIAVSVRPESPQRVAGDAILGWIGGVVAVVDSTSPLLRCEGEGTVLVALAAGRGAGGDA